MWSTIFIGAATLLRLAVASPVDYCFDPDTPITFTPPSPTPTSSDEYPTCTAGVTLCVDGFTCGQAWGG